MKARQAGILALLILPLVGCASHIPAKSYGLAAEMLKESVQPRWDGEGILHIPSRDAPADEVLAFWRGEAYGQGGMFVAQESSRLPESGGDLEQLTLSPAIRARILEAALADWRRLDDVLTLIPETPEARRAVFEVYERERKNSDFAAAPEYWEASIHQWLMHHGYFPADLLAAARSVKFDNHGYLDHDEDFQALTRLNWLAAEPLVKELAGNADPRIVTLANEACFTHAIRTQSSDAGLWREKLQTAALNKSASVWTRDRALKALVMHEWPGRDEWVLGLLDDASLLVLHDDRDFAAGPVVTWLRADPRRVARIVPLLTRPKSDLRANAAAALLESYSNDAFQAFLAHREVWNDVPQTSWVVALQIMRFEGSEDYLFHLATESNGAQRFAAAMALSRQDPPRAASFLREGLPHLEQVGRLDLFAAALIRSNALSDDEWYQCIRGGRWPGLADELFRFWPPPFIKRDFARLGEHEALAARLVADLPHMDSQAADELWSRISEWSAPPIDAEIMRRLTAEPLNRNLIALAVNRTTLATRHAAQLRSFLKAGGETAGVAAAILGGDALARRVLTGPDGPAAQMLLLSARLKGKPLLPLDAVGKLLASEDHPLAAAATAFLLTNDSPQARALIRLHHPGAYLVIGNGGMSNPGIEASGLIRELQLPQGPDEIFALFSGGNGWGGDGHRIIRVSGHAATMTYHPAGAQPASRNLTPAELQSFRELIARKDIDNLPPLRNEFVFDGSAFQYLHLTRDGGRELLISNPGVAGTQASPHDLLVQRFYALSPSDNAPPRYALETAIPGTRLLYHNPRFHIEKVAARDGALVVFVARPGSESAWRRFDDGHIAEPLTGNFTPLVEWRSGAAQPAGLNKIWVSREDEQGMTLLSLDLQTLDSETFAFLPGIYGDASHGEIWIDQAARKIYLAIHGDLLEVPISGAAPPRP